MKFNNQTAIITGAGSGIGRATAIEFAQKGANVVLSDINEEGGYETLSLVKNYEGQAIFIKTDISNNREVQDLIKQSIVEFGKIDHMINNAGIGLGFAFFDEIDDEHWNKMIAVNQTGVFYCMRAALKVMKAQKKGTILNVASAAGIAAAPRMGAYCASKYAVVGMTKTAAVEYGRFGIRVNAVCPTVIETPMGTGYLGGHPEIENQMRQMVPMKRFGKAEEVAKTICWLCSEEASYLNGVALPVDGGMKAV